MSHLFETPLKKFKKILKGYRDARAWPARVAALKMEYEEARRNYPAISETSALTPETLGIHVLIPGGDSDPVFSLPVSHMQHVEALCTEVARRLSQTSDTRLLSLDPEANSRIQKEVEEYSTISDMPIVKEGKIFKLFLKEVTDIPAFSPLMDPLAEQMERLCYHSHVWFEKAVVYRSIANIYPEKKSTLWHTDNHFESVIKIMVYLTDVGPDNAPFEYIRHKETGHIPRIQASMPTHFPGGRIPLSVIEQYEKKGYERVQVIGPKGTVLFFDDKIIHKGNEPSQGYRDALVVQFRPSVRKTDTYVTSETTSM